MANYQKLLLDPRWQKKRLQILERDDWQCKMCGELNETLHIHHFYYDFDLKPWEYDNKHLVTLCADCHNFQTESGKGLASKWLSTFGKMGIYASDISYISECEINISDKIGNIGEVLGFLLTCPELQEHLLHEMRKYPNSLSELPIDEPLPF